MVVDDGHHLARDQIAIQRDKHQMGRRSDITRQPRGIDRLVEHVLGNMAEQPSIFAGHPLISIIERHSPLPLRPSRGP
jgi:hypothetical protein